MPNANRRGRESDEVSTQATRVRCFCLTTHTGGDGLSEFDIVELVRRFANEQDGVRFVIGQLEKCPDTGRIHFQWYLQCHNPGTIASVKRKLRRVDERLNTTHIEIAQGTSDQNIEYCSKQSSRYVPEGATPEQCAVRHGQAHVGAGRGAGKLFILIPEFVTPHQY